MRPLKALLCSISLITLVACGQDSAPGAAADGSDGSDGSDGADSGYDSTDGATDAADATDGSDGLDYTDGTTPDEPGSCERLVCPAGMACDGGSCVPDGEVPCRTAIDVDLHPTFAVASQAVAAWGDRVVVATALGLEVYAAAPTPDETPTPESFLALDGVGLDVALSGGTAAVAQGPDGVTLVDLETMAPLGHVGSAGAVGVALNAGRLAIAEGASVSVWDVSDAAAPALVARVAVKAGGVALAGDWLYVAAHQEGLVAVDLTTPAAPVVTDSIGITGQYVAPGDAVRVRVAAGRAYVAAGYAGLRIYDLADPAHPAPLGAYTKDSSGIVASDVAVDTEAGMAYVSDFWTQLLVIDVSAPATPSVLGSYNQSGYTHGVAVAGGHAWVVGDDVDVFQVAAGVPTHATTFGNAGVPYGFATTVGIDAAGHVYSTEGAAGLRRYDPAEGGGLTLGWLYETAVPNARVSSIHVVGDRAYLGLDTTQPFVVSGELEVLDITGEPTRLGSLKVQGIVADVIEATPSLLYVADGSRLLLVDVTDPATPKTTSWAGESMSGVDRLDFDGDVLAVTRRYQGVTFFDVSDPWAPVELGTWAMEGYQLDVAFQNGLAYIGAGDAVDVVSPGKTPALVSRFALGAPVRGLAASQDRLWILSGGEILLGRLGTDLPLTLEHAAVSPGRSPIAIAESGGRVVVTDRYEPISRLTAGCVVPPSLVVPPGEPTASVLFVNVAHGAASLAIKAGDKTLLPALGYLQGDERLVPADEDVTATLDGATVAGPLPDVDRELVVLAGDAAAPVTIRAARQGMPAAGIVRLRVIHAVPGTAAAVTLRAGDVFWDTGTLALGDHSASIDLPEGQPLELWAATSDGGLLAALPPLAGSHNYDLILTSGADGDHFVVVQRDDGPTMQAGPSSHTARLRVANLARRDVSITLEEEADVAIGSVAPFTTGMLASLGSTDVGTVWPGARHLVVRDPESQEVLLSAPTVLLQRGEQYTWTLWERDDGSLAATLVADFTGQQTGTGTSELQLVHGAATLKGVDVRLYFLDSANELGGSIELADGLERGAVSDRLFPKTGSYAVGLDLDQNGVVDRVWDVGYFPDYGMSLFLAVDAAGRVKVGSQSPADGPIYWRYARDELANVRVLNLTGKDGLTVALPTWYEAEPEAEPVGKDASSRVRQVLAGEQNVVLTEPATGKSWTWTGSLEGESAHTIVFWKTPAGPVASYRLQDAPSDDSGSAIRFVNANPNGQVVTAWFAHTENGNGVLLGSPAAGDATAAWDAGPEGALSGGWIRVDRDGDGNADLRFSLGNAPSYRGITNVYWMEDATWPYLVVHGLEYLVEPSYAEELQTRVRILYLPNEADSLAVSWDAGEPFSMNSKPSWSDGVDANFGWWGTASMLAGAHTLTLGEGGALGTYDWTFEGESRNLVVISGDPAAPTVRLLDETGLDALDGPHRATVVNVGSDAVGVYAKTADGGWTAVVESVAAGAVSDTVTLAGTGSFGIDWGADGSVDWASAAGSNPGHSWVFATTSAKGTPALLVLTPSQYPWIGGDLVDAE
ncbi:MAG: hypothetical protein IV100_11435 [Myxococcales bacterium]|nr:hypothetical protein [Myxococcales bacterium]